MILKSKFYIGRRVVKGEDVHIEVYTDLGAFNAEYRAHNHMMKPVEDGGVIVMHRQPQFKGCRTIRGKDALRYPQLYVESTFHKEGQHHDGE